MHNDEHNLRQGADLDQLTDLFTGLTPERVLAAVSAAGLHSNPVCYALNSYENRVYEVELEDRSRIVAKFYRPGRWTAAQILEEHQYMNDLVAEEIPICALRPFPDGTTLKQIDGIYYCLYDRYGGRAPDEFGDDAVERLGMLVARLHNVGARRTAEHRIHLDANTYVRANLAWLDERDVVPPRLKERYFAAANGIADLADELMEGVPVHRIHGDFHIGNILMRDELFHVLDFDDMVVGPAVQDLWLVLPGRDRYAQRQREIFIEAYEQLRDFDRRTLRLIEPLRGLRIVRYTAWLAQRWHDPVFPETWPQFGTESYWDEETRDLEELLAIIRKEERARQAALTGEPVEEEENEEELTNKDFFWDWEDD